MTPDDKFTDHAWDTKQKDATYIDKYKGCATVLSGHKRKTPYIAETDGRTRRGKYNTESAAETASF